MGAVWVARHLQLDEQVAVKFMDISLPTVADARVRFEREAKSAARIRSPHVVQILDHGVDGEMPYIVMELLEGEHLGTRLKREGRLSLSAAAVLTEQVAKALHRAHKAGIIHRDLKPANVFLARVDDDEIVKILDFGIVKSMNGGGASGEATKSDVLMGSPNYMSPEQARGARTVDHRTDLWSLGVVLFRVITGKMAFSGDSVVDVILKICTGPVPSATAAAPDLPPEVDAFFARALERDPARRFSSAREMGADFSALVKALGPRADIVGPRPASSTELTENVQSSVMEVVSGPGSHQGTRRLRDLLQGGGETPTIAHARQRAQPGAALSPSPQEGLSKTAAPNPSVGTAAAWHNPQSETSAPLAAALKPPPGDPPAGAASLATLLRPSSGSPASAAPALLKQSPQFGKGGATPVPPAMKGAVLAKPSSTSAPMTALNPLPFVRSEEPGLRPEEPDSEREPSALILLSGANADKAPQSERSEIAQFVDQAFLALQASDPVADGTRMDLPAESTTSPESLLRLGPSDWPAGQAVTTPIVASLFSKQSSTTLSGSAADASPFGRARTDSSPPRPADLELEPRESTPPLAPDDISIIDPALSPMEVSRLKAQRAAHAGRISKLVDEGFTALKRGDREHARACWSEALSLDPTDRSLQLNLRKLETKGRS
jgi:serine/threonine-protein kinase